MREAIAGFAAGGSSLDRLKSRQFLPSQRSSNARVSVIFCITNLPLSETASVGGERQVSGRASGPPDPEVSPGGCDMIIRNDLPLTLCPTLVATHGAGSPMFDMRRREFITLCVPKIRFCNIGDEGRRGQDVM